MAKAQNEYTKMMKDMMGAFPVDTSAMHDVFKTQATFADKMSKVVLEAAEKSTEISAGWTKATIGKLGVITNAKDDPTDYTKAMTDFASAQAEMSAESMAGFAEVAKKVQMETVELMLVAGKDFGDEATKAVKKATDDVTTAAKKAAVK
ncbi:MAG: Phasin [Silicimonas sp.]|nr:Phasin [Silicimonas sp.]NNE59331.1 Phasin [Woeseia sp.]MBT8423933.1 Phasin [Silicimonas sp.]NND20357.1 Phasin [Silicimonas sp.]NND21964.1 Phasin [Silicimonas sp.]